MLGLLAPAGKHRNRQPRSRRRATVKITKRTVDAVRPGERDVAWIYGLITAALFLLSIVLHELGHAVVAQRDKLKVGSITLFFFGGVAQVEEEPRSAGVEFRVAVGGPLVSLALVVVFWAFSRVDQFGNLLEKACSRELPETAQHLRHGLGEKI